MVVSCEFQRAWVVPLHDLAYLSLKESLLALFSAFHFPEISTVPLTSFPKLHMPTSQGLFAWPPKPSFEIWIKAYMDLQLLPSAYSNNQRRVANAKVRLTSSQIHVDHGYNGF